ncbi:hypothetical protein VTN77DRAFT_418 [Rasamsonia byssochlamydoides]|uniref:uncharacterized protein n=1 Tax=Rasamsonia byssochlamydoides TaxID=89139 RepID=UPI003742E526
MSSFLIIGLDFFYVVLFTHLVNHLFGASGPEYEGLFANPSTSGRDYGVLHESSLSSPILHQSLVDPLVRIMNSGSPRDVAIIKMFTLTELVGRVRSLDEPATDCLDLGHDRDC